MTKATDKRQRQVITVLQSQSVHCKYELQLKNSIEMIDNVAKM